MGPVGGGVVIDEKYPAGGPRRDDFLMAPRGELRGAGGKELRKSPEFKGSGYVRQNLRFNELAGGGEIRLLISERTSGEWSHGEDGANQKGRQDREKPHVPMIGEAKGGGQFGIQNFLFPLSKMLFKGLCFGRNYGWAWMGSVR